MRIWSLLFLVTIFSCDSQYNRDRANKIINASINVHGGKHFIGNKVTFTFRDTHYEVRRHKDHYLYSRNFQKESNAITDILKNSHEFTRIINGDTVVVSEQDQLKFSRSVNSVLYFFQLPLLLNDPSAIKKFRRTVSIKGEPYYEIEVTFDEASGGEDFEDQFYYWIHQKSHLMDYMAYSYQTDGGGVRFREAYNRYEVGEILFQDYINFKAPAQTPLSELPILYQNGTLEVLSKIVNENIQVIPLKQNGGI